MSSSAPHASLLGLSYGWSYALAAFTLTITGCLPLAWLLTVHISSLGGDHGKALLTWLPIMALAIAAACAAFYWGPLRARAAWQRHVLMVMWALSGLGMVGWWKL